MERRTARPDWLVSSSGGRVQQLPASASRQAHIEDATERSAPWTSETNAECGGSAAFAKPRKRDSSRLHFVGDEPSYIPLLLARSMGAILMCLRLGASHVRTGASVFGMDTHGGESL